MLSANFLHKTVKGKKKVCFSDSPKGKKEKIVNEVFHFLFFFFKLTSVHGIRTLKFIVKLINTEMSRQFKCLLERKNE